MRKFSLNLVAAKRRKTSMTPLLQFAIAAAITMIATADNARSAEESTEGTQTPAYMSEDIRGTVDSLVIMAGASPASQDVTGTYEKATPGLVGGMDAGRRATTISKDIGGVPVNVPIPILTWPASIIGGVTGKTLEEIQDFRDALTEDLANVSDHPLHSDGLASDVYFGVLKVPGRDTRLIAPTTTMPEETDAILYVNVDAVAIDVQGKDAVLTTTASASLHQVNDNRTLYETMVSYQDRDTLGNWTENDNALWRSYANYARHYLGREIADEVFGRIELDFELTPVETDSVSRVKRNEWQGITGDTAPTLAWNLTLIKNQDNAALLAAIDESSTSYELEIYDERELVYAESGIAGRQHQLYYDLEPCKSYRWSVRPVYRLADKTRFGAWMRQESAVVTNEDGDVLRGIFGRKASEAPAYVQDFAAFEIKCRRR